VEGEVVGELAADADAADVGVGTGRVPGIGQVGARAARLEAEADASEHGVPRVDLLGTGHRPEREDRVEALLRRQMRPDAWRRRLVGERAHPREDVIDRR
jgi:hypothetical protein